jgi:hypothetical protein
MPKKCTEGNDAYKPNLNDARTARRVQRALSFCEHFLKRNRELRLHHTKVAEVFGNRGNRLADWLKKKLLIQCRGYVAGKHSFAYRLNPYGYLTLSKSVRGRAPIDTMLDEEVVSQIGRLEFAYKGEDESYRIWHPLQGLNREKKGEFWRAKGLYYNYDIVAALPNILYQSAIGHGAEPKRMTGLKTLIDDPKPFRHRFAHVAGVSYDVAKDCINSLFYGAMISASSYSSFGQKIGNVGVQALQRDPAVRSLIWAIKFAWRQIEEKAGKMTRSQRSYFYFREERRVLEVMRAHLMKSGNRHFCEHDGLIAEKPLDVEQLAQEIALTTGFNLKLALKPFA